MENTQGMGKAHPGLQGARGTGCFIPALFLLYSCSIPSIPAFRGNTLVPLFAISPATGLSQTAPRGSGFYSVYCGICRKTQEENARCFPEPPTAPCSADYGEIILPEGEGSSGGASSNLLAAIIQSGNGFWSIPVG